MNNKKQLNLEENLFMIRECMYFLMHYTAYIIDKLYIS